MSFADDNQISLATKCYEKMYGFTVTSFSHEQLCDGYQGLHKNGNNFITFMFSFSLQALQFRLVVTTIYMVIQGDKKKKDIFIFKISLNHFSQSFRGMIMF